jgi:hypothetical protein
MEYTSPADTFLGQATSTDKYDLCAHSLPFGVAKIEASFPRKRLSFVVKIVADIKLPNIIASRT